MDILFVDVPCVSSGMIDFDVDGSLLDVKRKCFNPGLLTIGTWCESQGLQVKIIAPESVLGFKRVFSELKKIHKFQMVALSIMSGMAYLAALEIIDYIKQEEKDIRIIAGGWHIRCIGKQIFKENTKLDAICLCEGEEAIYEYYVSPEIKHTGVIRRDDNIAEEDYCRIFDVEKLPDVDFCLYENYYEYRPFIEESRSCPRKCIHCVHSKHSVRYRCFSLTKFIKDFENCFDLFGKESYYTLLAANFGINPELTVAKMRYLLDKNISWSAEMHVENPWEKYIDLLAPAGMKSVSIGVETVAPRVLKVMRKTNAGKNYVERAQTMIREFHDRGISVKVNVMTYPDLTFQELQETLDFIKCNRKYIDNINTSAILSFPDTVLDDMFEQGAWKHSWKMKTESTNSIHLFPVESELSRMSYNNVLQIFSNFKDKMNFEKV